MKHMERIEQLQESAEFRQELEAIDSAEQLQQLLARYGVEVTLEEIDKMLAFAEAEAPGEMTLEELDQVSGGGLVSWLKKLLKKSIKKSTKDFKKLSSR